MVGNISKKRPLSFKRLWANFEKLSYCYPIKNVVSLLGVCRIDCEIIRQKLSESFEEKGKIHNLI